jgi:hypothetical protein
LNLDPQVALRRAVEWPRTKRHLFDSLGLTPPRGVLLYGPPGCAKTSLARAAAGSAGIAFISLAPADVYASSYVGEAEGVIRRVFSLARSAAPCILFFDEIDSVLGTSSGSSGTGANDHGMGRGSSSEARVLSTFLNEMDGVDTSAKDGVLVLAATNRPATLDAALLRPGRFDHVIYVPLPDLEARKAIVRKMWNQMGGAKRQTTQQEVDLGGDGDAGTTKNEINNEAFIHQLASEAVSGGFTGAEMVNTCQEAAMDALREFITSTSMSMSTSSPDETDSSPAMAMPHITAESLEAAFRKKKPMFASPDQLRQYQMFHEDKLHHNNNVAAATADMPQDQNPANDESTLFTEPGSEPCDKSSNWRESDHSSNNTKGASGACEGRSEEVQRSSARDSIAQGPSPTIADGQDEQQPGSNENEEVDVAPELQHTSETTNPVLRKDCNPQKNQQDSLHCDSSDNDDDDEDISTSSSSGDGEAYSYHDSDSDLFSSDDLSDEGDALMARYNPTQIGRAHSHGAITSTLRTDLLANPRAAAAAAGRSRHGEFQDTQVHTLLASLRVGDPTNGTESEFTKVIGNGPTASQKKDDEGSKPSVADQTSGEPCPRKRTSITRKQDGVVESEAKKDLVRRAKSTPDLRRSKGAGVTKPSMYLFTLLEAKGLSVIPQHAANIPTLLRSRTLEQKNDDKEKWYTVSILKAVRSGDLETIKILHDGEEQHPIQCANPFGESTLHLACRRNHFNVVAYMVNELKVNVAVSDDYGRTPLHDSLWAATPATDIVTLLLEKIPDMLYVKDKRGNIPLDYVREEHWGLWCSYLAQHRTLLVPKHLELFDSPASATSMAGA